MNLDILQKEVGEWSRRNFPNNKTYHPLLGIGEETGELMHAHLKLEQGIRGTPEEHVAAKKDAVGDIMIYMADYCERNGLDLDECVELAWGEVKQRDWRKHQEKGR
jgi:NTP pyrophosphatase (non-canonical NTP hydrolase)